MRVSAGYPRRCRLGVLGRFVGSLAALAMIGVGLPVLLVVCCRVGLDAAHPFPALGTFEEVRAYLSRGLSPAEVTPVMLRALLIVAWVLWLALVLSVVGAIVGALRGRGGAVPRFAVFSGVGRWIVAGLTSLSAVAPGVVAAGPAASLQTIVAGAFNPLETAAVVPSAGTPVRPGFARVQGCESIEMFAQRILGDGSRWPEIWELNRNRLVGPDGAVWTQAWRMSAGWDLLLPAAPAGSPTAERAGSARVPSLARIVAAGSSAAPAATSAGAGLLTAHRGGAAERSWSSDQGRPAPSLSGNGGRYVEGLMMFDASRPGGPTDVAVLPGGDGGAGVVPSRSAVAADLSGVGRDDGSVDGDGVPVYVVEAGDSYWGIAEDTLGEGADPGDVLALTSDLIDLNSPRFGYGDRRMIHPGDTVYLQDPATFVTPPVSPSASSDDPTPEPAATAPLSPAAPEPMPVPGTVPASPEVSPTSTVPATTMVDGAAVESPATSRRVFEVAALAGSVTLATGVALRLVWLRRRRATRGARHTHVTAGAFEHAVIAAGDVPLVRWAGEHVGRLVRQIDRRELTAGPVAVELSEGAGIEVLWDEPQHAAVPPGWTSADGGWAWRHSYDPDAVVGVDDVGAGIPALVTIGRREGRQLLVDLEGFGVLTVTGPDERVDAFLRSVAVELAVGGDLSDAHVATVGVATALDRRVGRLTVSDVDDAVQRLNRARRSVGNMLDDGGIVDTFQARCGRASIDAVVAVAGRTAPAGAARLMRSIEPRCGVAAVIGTDAPPAAGPHVRLDDDGTARLEPLGIDFIPVGLPLDTTTRIRDVLGELADLPDEPDDDDTSVDVCAAAVAARGGRRLHRLFDPGAVVPDVTGNGDGDGDGADASGDVVDGVVVGSNGPIAAALGDMHPGVESAVVSPELVGVEPSPMIVRVLGVPSIPLRPGLARRELILAVLLACRGGTVAASAAQDALWGGKAVEAKTVWNFVTRTRTALGEFPDGRAVMPAADRTRGTLRLDRHVTTDLDLLVGGLEQARRSSSGEAIGLLRECLALVDGPPFDAAGYDWAHRDQDVAYASTAIEQAAETLVKLALEADLVDVAREAITRGLRGLPGNEPLYRCRMRVEHHAGNHSAIVAAYDELGVYLADLDAEVSPATTALYHDLTRHHRTGRARSDRAGRSAQAPIKRRRVTRTRSQ